MFVYLLQVSHNQTHVFSEGQTSEVQEKLLAWFDKNKREMPWRDLVCTTQAESHLFLLIQPLKLLISSSTWLDAWDNVL